MRRPTKSAKSFCPHCTRPVLVEARIDVVSVVFRGIDLLRSARPVSSAGAPIVGLFEARWRGQMYEVRLFDLMPWTDVGWYDRDGDGYVANFVANEPAIRATSIKRIRRLVEVAVRRRIDAALMKYWDTP